MAIKRPQPDKNPRGQSVDDWVATRNGKPSVEENTQEENIQEEIKRFTVLIPKSQHSELKAFCAKKGVSLKDFVIEAIMEKMSK